jgi:transcriptional regulator with XRE-family HTH domain
MAKKQPIKKAKSSVKKTIDPDVKKLAARIKSLRIKKGYTNYEYFAYDNNIARTQYGRYEQGEDIRFSSLMKVIRAFGMTPEEFFSEGFK